MKNTLLLSTALSMLSFMVLAGDPVAQMTFRVVNDFGNVVTGAPVTVSTFLRWVPGGELGHDEFDQVSGLTDTNGLITLKLPSKTGNMRYAVDGVFDGMNKMEFGNTTYYVDRGSSFRFTNHVEGQWQPWNPTVEILVKEVVNPIPMYSRFIRSRSFPIPDSNRPLGYDLLKSDWLPPYGRGETSDFIIHLDCQLGGMRKDRIQIFDAVLTLSFSNDGDGIQEFIEAPKEGSALRLPRFAPEAGYATNWVSHTFAHEDSDYCEFKENQNFFYRVRVSKDEEGRITNALYGKIVGPLFYEVRTRGANMQMKYYLNPTPNDRNMEFDPSQNLFTNLPEAEQVRDP